MRNRGLFFAVCTIAALNLAVATAATLHVAPSGDDGNAGTTGSPIRTIQKAAELARAGDTVLVHAGVYKGLVLLRFSGEPEHPITFKNAPGEKPVVDGERRGRIELQSKQGWRKPIGWVTVQGFEVRNGWDGIKFYNAHHIVLKGNFIHDNDNQGILGNGHHVRIEGNVIAHNGFKPDNEKSNKEHGIYATGTDFEIINNVICSNRAYGIQVAAYPFKADSHAGPEFASARRWYIAHNTIAFQQNRAGIVVWQPEATDCVIENNIFFWNAVTLGGGDCQGIDFAAAGAKHIIQNNLFFGPGRTAIQGNSGDYIATANLEDKDPLFADAERGDFHLREGSPAIDSASAQSAVSVDIEGVPRPQGKARDIGAFEYSRDIRPTKPSFPRLMGMNIGAKNYDDPGYQKQLARLDLVILGFYNGWKPDYEMAKVVRNLKELSNGKILVGQYTILNECYDDPRNGATLDILTKLNDMDWWARKADGSRVQWTTQYHAWDINFTAQSRPDANEHRFPQWLAERDDSVFFKPVPFDLWYCDNVFFRPRVTADWDRDGTDDDPKSPVVAAAYRAGHRAEWDRIRQIHPGLPLMGNTDGGLSEPEYAGQLDGAFLEGLMGKSWSVETWGGWAKVMTRYRDAMANTRMPHMVGFNVHGNATDFRFFRYAYTSCLLDDGYFCFTDNEKEYSSVTWFDEFDFKLGAATTPPPVSPWQGGVWRRDFELGIVLVNPTKQAVTLTLDLGFCRLKGKQDPVTNDGNPATSVLLQARDGLILRRQ